MSGKRGENLAVIVGNTQCTVNDSGMVRGIGHHR